MAKVALRSSSGINGASWLFYWEHCVWDGMDVCIWSGVGERDDLSKIAKDRNFTARDPVAKLCNRSPMKQYILSMVEGILFLFPSATGNRLALQQLILQPANIGWKPLLTLIVPLCTAHEKTRCQHWHGSKCYVRTTWLWCPQSLLIPDCGVRNGSWPSILYA